MKTTSARNAKNAFGLMIDTARAKLVLIEKHGRGVVMVIVVQEYGRLTVRPMPEERQIGRSQGDREMTDEALARIKIDRILIDAEWRRTGGLSTRRKYPPMKGDEPTTCCPIARNVRSSCHYSGVAPGPHPHFLG